VAQKLTLLAIALSFVALVAYRVWRAEPRMPAQVDEAGERMLHLTPGGKYTQADVDANGRMIPSQKYRGFQARHDVNPRSGVAICPITRTKANRECTWIVDGRSYQFCCPPCIDEFVRLAKEQPERILAPGDYVK
jgi:hypothetical protein